MPDFQAVLSSVEDRLAVVARRREELERQCADVAREHDRLAATVAIMKEHAGLAGQPSTPEAADPPVSDRVLDALVGSSANSRATLLQYFRPLGLNENSIDSAIKRLKKRGVVQQRGKLLVPVESPSPASVPQLSPDSAVSDVGQGRTDPTAAPGEADPGPAPGAGAVAVPHEESADAAAAPRASSGDGPSNRDQVLDAVVALGPAARPVLVQHLGARGFAAGSVDSALKGLRGLGKIERRPDGKYVVVAGSDVPAPRPDASQVS